RLVSFEPGLLLEVVPRLLELPDAVVVLEEHDRIVVAARVGAPVPLADVGRRPREGGVHHTLPVLPDVHHAGVVVDVDRHANPPAERKARCAGAERDRAAGVPDVRRGEAAARILEAEGDDALDPAAATVGGPEAQPAPA